jgi:hypothetical protein
MQRKVMYMANWIQKLHEILTVNDRPILMDFGKVTHEQMESITSAEYEKYLKIQDEQSIQNLKSLEEGAKNAVPVKSTNKTKAPKKDK